MRQQHFSESVILMWLIPRFPLFLASLKESALRKGRSREDLARCLCSSHERAGANWPRGGLEGGRLARRLCWGDDKTSWQHSLNMFCALCTGFLHRCTTMATPKNKPPQKALQSQSAKAKRPDQDLFNLCIAPTPKQGAWHCAGRCKRSLAMQPACSNANYQCCGGLCALFCYVTVCISFSPVFGCQVLRRGASYKLRVMPPFSHSSGKKSFGRGRTLRANCRVCSPLGDVSNLGELGGHIFDAKVLFVSPLMADKEGLRDDTCKPAYAIVPDGAHMLHVRAAE